MRPGIGAFLLAAMFVPPGQGQVNVWTQVTGGVGAPRYLPYLCYLPAQDEFLLTLGSQDEYLTPPNPPYTVQAFKRQRGYWINSLPHDTLYGKWADSTGPAYGFGRVGDAVFAGFWQRVQGYLRPNIAATYGGRNYGQGSVNTSDGKIYFYQAHMTFSYDPALRRWDTLSVTNHPSKNTSGEWISFLKWGSLCYDPINDEILLFGGGSIDAKNGSPGTWTFKPQTSTWTRLGLEVEPPPRAYSPMVYDAKNQVIVLFGGDHLDGVMSDTWVYRCSDRTWIKKNPARRPFPRAGHVMLYMPKSQKVVMFGGYTHNGRNPWGEMEMWTYDAAADSWGFIKRFASPDIWPKQHKAKGPYTGQAAADTGDVIIALGDSTFWLLEYNSANPMTYRLQFSPVIDANGTQTYGITTDSIMYGGSSDGYMAWTEPGYYLEGSAAPDTAANELALRNLPVGVWTKISAPRKPGGWRHWGTTIYDPEHDMILKWDGGHVVWGGNDVPQYSPRNNRWYAGYRPEFPMEYEATTDPCAPGPFSFSGRPFIPTHTVKSYAYDVKIHKMIFSSDYHTWIYDPVRMDWDTVHIHNPWGRGIMAAYQNGLVGTPHGVLNWNQNSSRTNRIYLFNGALMNWAQVSKAGASVPAYYADNTGVVYDSKRDRVLFIQSNGSNPATVYEFRFSDSVCAALTPSNGSASANAGFVRDCAYLPNQDKVIFQRYWTTSASLLTYDCAANAWTTFPVTAGTGVPLINLTNVDENWGTGFMYDASRNLVWWCDHENYTYALRPDTSHGAALEGNAVTAHVLSLEASPNPFNPSTKIRLPSGWRGGVVEIFSVGGRRVANLSATLGTKSLMWNASALPSGLYVIRSLCQGKQQETRAVLLK